MQPYTLPCSFSTAPISSSSSSGSSNLLTVHPYTFTSFSSTHLFPPLYVVQVATKLMELSIEDGGNHVNNWRNVVYSGRPTAGRCILSPY